jgi:hypothetical protein
VEDMVRQVRAGQFLLEGKEKTFKMELNVLNNTIDQLKEQVREKRNYVHPMRYEDVLSAAINYQRKMTELKK